MCNFTGGCLSPPSHALWLYRALPELMAAKSIGQLRHLFVDIKVEKSQMNSKTDELRTCRLPGSSVLHCITPLSGLQHPVLHF